MTEKIYDQHNTAFNNVAGFVLMRGTKKVATIAIKYPNDGAGRLYAYFHILGCEMTRGCASGYGYDKGSAAIKEAVNKIENVMTFGGTNKDVVKIQKLLAEAESKTWYNCFFGTQYTLERAI